MKKNIKSNKDKANVLFKIEICLALLFVMFLSMDTSYLSYAKENEEFCYLSDIPYVEEQSSVGWREISLDKTPDNTAISMKVEGSNYTFEKGIFAHATSTVVYDLTNYADYDYFTAYIGLNTTSTRGDGVIFDIFTSQDGTNWASQIGGEPIDKQPGQNATFVKINIKNVKFLKLCADDKASNASDHSVYADAKLIKQGYDDSNGIKTLAQYDEMIKNYEGQEITGDYELALLQRELVKRAGEYALKRFSNESQANKQTLSWLMNDLETLRLYMMGGTPDGGSYYNSLKILSELYNTYKTDFDITQTTKYGTVLGDLYKKMAITLSLTHSQRVALWMQPSNPGNQSNAVTRYQIFKDLHKNGKFIVSSSIDITQWFESYNVEEMRFVFNNLIDDEEILWLNEYTQKQIDAHPNQTWSYLTPHPYMAYVTPNYGNPIFHDPAKKDYWDQKFDGIFSKYGVTYSTEENKIYKVWMNFRNEFGTGAVCGGISKTGSNIRTVHGIPAAVIGQPGHAAIIYYSQDTNGNGYWNLDNDVSGWTLSEKGERLLLGWGNANTNYAKGSYQVVYMALAQEALNDYENFEKCEETVMLANAYQGDLEKQEEIYRKALKIQPINIDAWLGLINVYNANTNKTENEYFELAKEVAENLKYFPLPMQQLTNLIKPHLTSMQNLYRFTLLQTRILTQASQTPNNSAEHYYVYQPSLTRLEANFLLGKLDKTIATFSFDGEDAGKIVLSSRFDGNGVRWDYSIDGKQNWKEVSFTAEEEHKLQLTPEEINSITAENDIYVHIVGVNYDEENLYKIDIKESTGLPQTLYANDLENRFIGATPTIQWKFKEGDDWKFYSEKEPDLTGDKTVILRMGATGEYLASTTSSIYTFTQNNLPENRQYIPISHLSIHGVSSEATNNQGAAVNAIDGNANTRYHSAWNGSDTQRYMIVKLDEPVYLSAVEYIPAGGGNGKILDGTIYGSMDGENWEILSQQKNLTYTNQANTVGQAIENTKAFEIENLSKVQYIKIVADRASNGNWFCARMFNFYENKEIKTSVKFSFDGEEAGRIILEDEFENADWSYSIDGGATWKAGRGRKYQLTDVEINQINENDKIRVRFRQSGIECTVNIKKGEAPKIRPYVNDLENRLIGLDKVDLLEWKLLGENVWKSYEEQEPVVIGTQKLLVRNKATGFYTASDWIEYEFTEDNQPDTAKYVPIKHLSVHEFSTQSVDASRPFYALNAIDGNRNTIWHTDFRDNVLQQKEKPFITIKLDEPKYISALEFVQKKYKANDPDAIKNGIVYVSMDGENWVEAGRKENCEQNEEFKRIEFGESRQAQYVKFEMETYGMFASVAMINLYEDVTKIETPEPIIPTADLQYDRTELTNQDVTVTLVNPSTKITVTNNSGNISYVFTENGEFTFEFEDKAGNKGTATAKVDWIDKVAPIATITYSTLEETTEKVTARITFDKENVIITNNEGKDVYTFKENGEFTFEFEDKAGNKGTATAKVDWIKKEEEKPEEPEKPAKATIEYSTLEETTEEVTATIKFDKEDVKITNNEGKNTYVFAENGEFTFEFEDKAGNKGTATAKVDWIKKEEEKPEEPEKPEGIISKVYKIEEKHISKVLPKTTVNQFMRNVETKQQMVFLDETGNPLKQDDVLGTGTILKLGSTLQYTIIVTGDTDGNGKITMTDLASLRLHYIGKEQLTGNALKAGDIDENGKITITDLAQVRLVLVEK